MEQKVILINLPPSLSYSYKDAGSIYPATGLLLIGTIMKNRGLRVQLIDGAIDNNYNKTVLAAIDKDTKLVGFSVMTSQVFVALELSKLIKKIYPHILIIWGGVHPILFPEQTLSNPNIDMIATGEGFETVVGIIDHFDGKLSLEEVKGLGFKDASGRVVLTEPNNPDDINIIPHFDFRLCDNIEIYLNSKSNYQREIDSGKNANLRVMPILTALGCCYRCQFCINVILKRRYRCRSAQSIIEEIKKRS